MPTAIITGASSGIGAAFARILASGGMKLVLVARRADRLKKLADELRHLGAAAAIPLPADLTQETDFSRVLERIDECADLDLLINGAGFGVPGRLWDTAWEPQRALIRLRSRSVIAARSTALHTGPGQGPSGPRSGRPSRPSWAATTPSSTCGRRG